MRHVEQCKVCQYGPGSVDWNKTNAAISIEVDCSKDSVRRHRLWATVNGIEPDTLLDTVDTEGAPSWVSRTGVPRRAWQLPDGTWRQSFQHATDDDEGEPAWPLIDRPAPLPQTRPVAPSLIHKWRSAVAGGDTQIGFRRLSDGTMDPFHDDDALALFNQLVEMENPDQTVLVGDIVDMPEQGKYAQELAFSGTTQAALDRTYEWLHDMRSRTSAAIHLIEGNHDRRLQNFVELNALSAFGLRKAGWPESWPVMSLPYLLRLDELNVTYYDAYPNAHVWINDVLRAEHGTKANSRGSTAQQYLADTPHISRIIGHSHRQEIVQRTTWDRVGKIKSQVINPGCLCRVDGAVPSVNGSIGANGKPVTVYEDWQQGAAIIRYTDDKIVSELVQFDDGVMVHRGVEYTAVR